MNKCEANMYFEECMKTHKCAQELMENYKTKIIEFLEQHPEKRHQLLDEEDAIEFRELQEKLNVLRVKGNELFDKYLTNIRQIFRVIF